MAEPKSLPLPLVQATKLVRRRGWHWQVAAALALLVLVGAVFGYRYLSDRFSPASIATSYATAVAAGDADTAWSSVVVDRSVTTKPDVDLATQAGFAAQVKLIAKSGARSGLRSTLDWASGDRAEVQQSWRTGSQTASATLLLVRDSSTNNLLIFPVWKVVLASTAVSVTVPTDAGQLSIDGINAGVAAGKPATISLLPGAHQAALAASTIYDASTSDFTATASGAQAQTLQLSPKLSAASVAAITQTVKAAFVSCASTPESSCPQVSGYHNFYYVHTWKLVGDPVAGLAVALSGSAVKATGSYQMIGSYDTYNGPSNVLAAGPYNVSITATGSGWQVGDFQASAGSPTTFQKPAGVTDAQVKDAVAGSMTTCAAITKLAAAGCPNAVDSAASSVSNVHWTVNADPLAGATVVYDGSVGAFQVKGTFSMTADYDRHILYTNDHVHTPITGSYVATVVPDASSLFVVGIKPIS